MAISALFTGGQAGIWYDPNDLSTLFQDTAGTVPVTAAGQSVALMRDKSGNGNHASQATSSKRPVLTWDSSLGRYYLNFDGVDDWLKTVDGASNSATQSLAVYGYWTIFSGWVSTFPATATVHQSPWADFGLFSLNPTNGIQARLGSTATNLYPTSLGVGSAPAYVTQYHTSDGALYINTTKWSIAGPSGSVAYPTPVPFILGANVVGSECLDLRLYGLVLLGRNMTTGERSSVYTDLTTLSSTGTASGSVSITGAASGQAKAAGQGSGSVSITGGAQGGAQVQGQASGGVSIAGAAQGGASAQGQGAGSVPISGQASGQAKASGQGAGAVTVFGAGTATVTGGPSAGLGAVAIQCRVRRLSIPARVHRLTIPCLWRAK